MSDNTTDSVEDFDDFDTELQLTVLPAGEISVRMVPFDASSGMTVLLTARLNEKENESDLPTVVIEATVAGPTPDNAGIREAGEFLVGIGQAIIERAEGEDVRDGE